MNRLEEDDQVKSRDSVVERQAVYTPQKGGKIRQQCNGIC